MSTLVPCARAGAAMLTFLCGFLFVAAACAQVQIDTIALTGEVAPGFEPPAAFSVWGDNGFFTHRRPYINNLGEVLFGGEAFPSPPGANYDNGLWVSQTDGALRLAAFERQPAPGTEEQFAECIAFDDNDRCIRLLYGGIDLLVDVGMDDLFKQRQFIRVPEHN